MAKSWLWDSQTAVKKRKKKNCMLPLVTLGFPQLLLFYFLVSCCYWLFLVLLSQPQFFSWLSLSNLSFTWLNLVDISVSSEAFVILGLIQFNLVHFSDNSSVIFPWLILSLSSLKSS